MHADCDPEIEGFGGGGGEVDARSGGVGLARVVAMDEGRGMEQAGVPVWKRECELVEMGAVLISSIGSRTD